MASIAFIAGVSHSPLEDMAIWTSRNGVFCTWAMSEEVQELGVIIHSQRAENSFQAIMKVTLLRRQTHEGNIFRVEEKLHAIEPLSCLRVHPWKSRNFCQEQRETWPPLHCSSYQAQLRHLLRPDSAVTIAEDH
jgi:hypothetical protein